MTRLLRPRATQIEIAVSTRTTPRLSVPTTHHKMRTPGPPVTAPDVLDARVTEILGQLLSLMQSWKQMLHKPQGDVHLAVADPKQRTADLHTKSWDQKALHAFAGMFVYLERLGIGLEDLDTLPVIHVAGTKGKGSTCAMVDSILRQCGYTTGLYTSPHLVDVRERIRINGHMVSKQVFEEEFWKCYNRFVETATPELAIPGYFKFLTLLALKIFLQQNLDVVVLEVGIGGRVDATNVIPHPVACGITSLGFDHMEILGDTLPKIAREKAGILKAGRPGFTVSQPEDAMEALHEVAGRVGAPLKTVGTLDQWRPVAGSTLQMSLGGDHQRINAGLAVQLCLTYERDRLAQGQAAPGAAQRCQLLEQGLLPAEYVVGLNTTTWPGRSQVVHDTEFMSGPATDSTDPTTSNPLTSSRLSFFIDGAHTPESMVTCAEWFASQVNSQTPTPSTSTVERVLLFHCMPGRSPAVLLPALASALATRGVSLPHVLFVPPSDKHSLTPTKTSQSTGPAATASMDSTAARLAGAANGPAAAVTDSPAKPAPDFSWQLQLQSVWESQCAPLHGLKQGVASHSNGHNVLPLPTAQGLPSDPTRGAVVPSLSSAIEWLRAMARARPQLQLQVLVTGSLYLVGDVLRETNNAPK